MCDTQPMVIGVRHPLATEGDTRMAQLFAGGCARGQDDPSIATMCDQHVAR